MIFRELTHQNAKILPNYLKDISAEENKPLFGRNTFPTLKESYCDIIEMVKML